MRPLVLLLFGPLVGCIIYEEKYTTTTDGCVECTTTGPGQPQSPQLTDTIELTVTEGLPGESVLTNLVPVGSGFDMSRVVAVDFERDIETSDILVRDFEVVLLLQISQAAAPGSAEVYVRTDDGAVWVLTRPFDILPPVAQPTGSTGDTGTTDTGTTDTGTTDTGITDTGDPPTGDTGTSADTGSSTGDTGGT
jgi:hypothetical protein